MTEEAFVFPASFAQARLWFFDQLEAGSPLYNMPIAVRLTGPLQVELLERSLNEIVERHEALRTTFPTVDGQPVQVVKPSLSLMLPVVDLRDLPEAEREREALSLAAEELRRPFNLAHGPLLRARLLRLSAGNHILTLAMHHIIGDGWSLGVLLRELAALYEAFVTGQPPLLSELPIQYADYAVWQRDWLQGEVLESQLSYWKEQLADAPALELPSDHTRPPTDTFHGARQAVMLPKALTAELKALSRREGATLFMTLLTVFKTLLYRYTGQPDIVVGSPIAGRNLDEVKDLIGFFVNTLVLRTDLSGTPTFGELLGRVRRVCLDAFSHQDVPFEKLVNELQPERDLGRNPLFQVMFALQNAPMPPMKLAGLTLRPLELHTATSRFDLTIELWETSDGLRGLVEYNTDLFEASTISRMLKHFRNLLEGAVADAEQCISDLPLLRVSERQRLLVTWNDTATVYPQSSCVHELFEAHVDLTPDAVAVVFEDTMLTYHELNLRANRLAHYLRGMGVGPETLVGLCVTRSLEMVIGLLGILKAGGAYVPLDAKYPQNRLAYMLEDAQVSVVLTQDRLADRLSALASQVVRLDADWERIARESEHNPHSVVEPENLAYVIYTSGSTGRPKGVLLRHRGLCNLVNAQTRAFEVDGDSRVLQFASFSFDASVSEVFMALLTGATLYVTRQDTLISGPDLLKLLRDRGITTVTLPPSVLRVLSPDGLTALRTLISAGEACDPEIVARWSPGRRFINAYGPTEATIGPTLCVVEDLPADAGSVPIGRPIANTQTYLLDADLRPLPPGVPGELHIGGAGLARGYLNRPDLTAKSFIPDPFSDEPGARLYRTGDLARYLPDGAIEFLGRIDHQVKVRGFRVELSEIEVVMGRHPGVQAAVVLAREVTDEQAAPPSGDRRLVGYIVPRDGQRASLVAELRSALRETLPEYMVPSAFVTLETLPLTPSGKVDRRALPAPSWSGPGADGDFIAPRNPIEEMLAGIWGDVLGLEQVSVHDSFFNLGGHSLLATQVISRLREAFQVELPVRSLFEAPTIAGLAQVIAEARQATQGAPLPPIEPVPRDGDLPLSFAQQRLWFLDRLEPDSPFYNIPAAARLSGLLDVTALRESLNEIVRRHEALRTTFTTVHGRPVQVVASELTVPMPVVDLTALPENDREAETMRLTTAEAQRPFDLAEGPLLRAHLLALGAEEHIILLTMHHIVSDNWSMGVTIRELATLYATCADEVPRQSVDGDAPLPELPVQYADFAHWQRRWLNKDALEDQLAYWKQHLEGLPPLLELPTDRPRPAVQSFRGANRWFKLPKGLSRDIRAFGKREGTTLFMTLLAAFQTLLYRYTGQRDICVGTPIANRNRAQIEGLIGFFVNTLVMRSDLSGDPSFRQLLQRVREAALGAYDHQDVPFEMLVDELKPRRDLSHTALFQVMFALQNAQMEPLELPGLSLNPLEVDPGTAKFDLTLSLEDRADGLTGQVNYNKALFDSATIDRMVGHLQTLLESIVAHPEQPVSQLPIFAETERQQLLVDWNDTEAEFARNRCIHELFQGQVLRTPQAAAAAFDGEQLTYAELNGRANQLAHYLRKVGVGLETLVGVCTERSLDMVVGLLGIIKAGGAYVPLDPTYPEDRLRLMLEDSRASLVLTQARLRERISLFKEQAVRSVCLDTDWDAIAQEPRTNPESGATPDNLAYAIYTSGSTGRPKGTLLEHRGLCNYVPFYIHEFDMGPGDTVLQFASISFDASVPEIFGALLSGATLQLARPEVLLSPDDLTQLLRDRRVTFSIMPPSLLSVLRSEGLSTLEKLMSAGEACPPAVAREWASGRRLFNGYGPTEATVGPGLYEVSDVPEGATSIPIGRPITNTRIYLLDANGQPVPIGVSGEVCIGGVGLARGYLNRPDLTADRFIPSPFSDEPGTRLYRTGDLARYRPDGTMAFLGRIDHQVKVRGFRVELGEVETALARHPGVREGVVVAREGQPGGKRLTGYVVCHQEPGPAVGELRDFLKDRLPEYMVPSVFVKLEELPLTPSGKVDRRALPTPTDERPDLGTAYVTPRNKMERSIASIWEDVLGVERVGINDNFFDLGGHSLLMAQVHGRLQQVWQADLSMVDLFRYPTISALVEHLSRERGAGVSFEEEGDRVSRQKEALKRQRQRMSALARKPR